MFIGRDMRIFIPRVIIKTALFSGNFSLLHYQMNLALDNFIYSTSRAILINLYTFLWKSTVYFDFQEYDSVEKII